MGRGVKIGWRINWKGANGDQHYARPPGQEREKGEGGQAEGPRVRQENIGEMQN